MLFINSQGTTLFSGCNGSLNHLLKEPDFLSDFRGISGRLGSYI